MSSNQAKIEEYEKILNENNCSLPIKNNCGRGYFCAYTCERSREYPFKNRLDALKHVLTCKKGKSYACTTKDAGFAHEPEHEKPFECIQCEKRFKQKIHVQRHIQSHVKKMKKCVPSDDSQSTSKNGNGNRNETNQDQTPDDAQPSSFLETLGLCPSSNGKFYLINTILSIIRGYYYDSVLFLVNTDDVHISIEDTVALKVNEAPSGNLLLFTFHL
jgi:hypothetical protein